MEAVEFTDQTCIIVVDVFNGEDQALTGIVVDKVSEVLNIHSAGIKILLNIDLVLNTSEFSFVETGTSEAIEKPSEELTKGG